MAFGSSTAGRTCLAMLFVVGCGGEVSRTAVPETNGRGGGGSTATATSTATSTSTSTATSTATATPTATATATSTATSAAVAESTASKRFGIPTVTLSPPTVGPAYAPELVTRVLRLAKKDLQRCGELASDKSKPIATLRFAIGADGKVDKADFVRDGAPVSPDAVQDCILGVIRSLSFPARSGGTLIVSYPFNVDSDASGR